MKLTIAVAGALGLAAIAPLHSVIQAQQASSVLGGVYTEAQAKRGADVYDVNCASCHGPALAGTEMAPPLNGPTFVTNWAGTTVGDLFQKINVAMPADDPGKLTPEQTADVVSHILSVNKYPAGKADLGKDLDPLKQIKIEAPKP